MTRNKSPELEDRFIDYFKVTKFKTQQISTLIVANLQNIGPMKIVSF